MLFSETWLAGDNVCKIDNFECFNVNRKRSNIRGMNSGGIAIYRKTEIKNEIIWIKYYFMIDDDVLYH